jgi:hypothetical protein
MKNEPRDRIRRPATPEEKERHDRIRSEIAEELPDLKQWAKAVASQHKDRIAVGTVFTADETQVVAAIDEYAASHSLQSRGAVVRQALAQLLGIQVAP